MYRSCRWEGRGWRRWLRALAVSAAAHSRGWWCTGRPAVWASAQSRTAGPGLGDGPALLSAIAEAAVERNREILDAEYELALANRQVTEAWSDFYPSVSLSSSYTRNVGPAGELPAGPDLRSLRRPKGDFIPDAVRSGQHLESLRQPRADRCSTPGYLSASERRVEVPRIADGRFFAAGRRRSLHACGSPSTTCCSRRRRCALTGNSLKRVRRSLEETRAMEEAGVAEVYDVLRLEVELANLEPNQRRAENRLRAARRTLAAELGLRSGFGDRGGGRTRARGSRRLRRQLPGQPGHSGVQRRGAGR